QLVGPTRQFSGPTRRAHSVLRIKTMGPGRSPPPRTVVGTDDPLIVELPETMHLFCDHVGVIRHPLVFHRLSPFATVEGGDSTHAAMVRLATQPANKCSHQTPSIET